MSESNIQKQSNGKKVRTFREVFQGSSKPLMLQESRRCPQCSDPVCLPGCPLGIDIPGFIRLLREERVKEAYQKIKEKNPLPGICGRLCHAPCEEACVFFEDHSPITIQALERYASDHGRRHHFKKQRNEKSKCKVAVIGSGPSGLAAAAHLAQSHVDVTVYEALENPGGVLRYAVADFRLPKNILDQEIEEIQRLGVEIQTNCFLGQTLSLEELQENFDAVLLSVGAGVPRMLDLPGTSYQGVLYGDEFLIRMNQVEQDFRNRKKENFALGEKIIVLGAGYTALDCARTAVRLRDDVTMIFAHDRSFLKSCEHETLQAEQEGVHLIEKMRAVEILSADGKKVSGVRCQRSSDALKDELILDADTVIISVGHQPNVFLNRLYPNLKLDSKKRFMIDDNHMTSIKGVFACGNVILDESRVLDAIVSGKETAEKIKKYLKV